MRASRLIHYYRNHPSVFRYEIIHPKALLIRVILTLFDLTDNQIPALQNAKYDLKRFINNAGVFHSATKENLLASITHTYHVIEKGLTMPHRRMNFGHDGVNSLIDLTEEYILKYGEPQGSAEHAISVLKAYLDMHIDYDGKDDAEFWEKIHRLTDRYPNIKPAYQPHLTSEEFYKDVHSDFAKFAHARHTLRHYTGCVSEQEISQAVELAMTTPSACNRQPVRVHCISAPLKDKVLDLQGGNRGFGKDADKVLVITGDLADICWVDERNDIYTNCGMFIMNLSYSLFYYKIAHCILNWSVGVNPKTDQELRRLLSIPDNEVISAMIVCGKTPDEVDVAMSPRREIDDIIRFH